MNKKQLIQLTALIALLSALNPQPSTFAQGTAFTYQGRLTDNGSVATGYYDILFSLYDAASGGSQLDGTLMGTAVPVTNGLFTISLDFGSGIFTGPGRWLKLDVRTNGVGPYNPLSPRQALTATPYAVTAGNMTGNLSAAQVSGTLALTQLPGAVVTNNASGVSLAGAFTGNGAGVSNVNALTLGGLGAASFWKTAGNAGTTAGTHFLGTTDNQALELKANNARAMRLEPNTNGAPNLIGGSQRNFVGAGVVGATIGGGGATNWFGGAITNSVLSDFGTVGGGVGNNIGTNSPYSTIAGGGLNSIADSSDSVAIAGGGGHSVGTNSPNSAIGGGLSNFIGHHSPGSVISGGNGNIIADHSGTAAIVGGEGNLLDPDSYDSMIGGGADNYIGTNSPFATLAGGLRNNILQDSEGSTIAGGGFNSITAATGATIAGGSGNSIAAGSVGSSIGGGQNNFIADGSLQAIIAGGSGCFIGPTSVWSTVSGGSYNVVADHSSDATIAGGYVNYIGTNCHESTIGGGFGNWIADSTLSRSETIAGGIFNLIGSDCYGGAIGGGSQNTIADNSVFAMIPGGWLNSATNYAFAAGTQAKAIHNGAFVWGDSTRANLASTNADSVTMRASGGYRLFTDTNATAGVFLAPGGTSWAVISDRNAKKDFAPLDSKAILEKLASMPITQWHYKWEDQGVTPHIGPMAQDFKAAFYPGSDDKSITTQEADGVELAAIQALNQKLEQKETEITELKESVAELKEFLSRLAHQQDGGAR